MTGPDPLLSVRDLTKHYPIREGILKREVGRVRAVDGVDFDIGRGEIVGLVGESGCGKSTVAQTVLRLEEPTGGTITFDGEDVTAYDEAELRRFRRRAQIIFQDPDSSFDPRMSIGESVGEPLRVQGMRDRDRRRQIVGDLLERVGLSASDARQYPHEFSGGQKQRIALARALSVNPELIIADEPVSALDVSTKAEILGLIADLQAEFDLSILLISHDISIVEQICDRVSVMYLGEMVEQGPTPALFGNPQHPYTESLLASVPTPDPTDRSETVELTGDVPSPSSPPPGCRFHTRCPKVIQPADYEFEQDAWRRVMAFRQRLRDAQSEEESDVMATVATINERIDPPRSIGDDSPRASTTELDPDQVRPEVREALDLPTSLTDPRAEAVLATAIDHVLAGALESATETLADAFETPCEVTNPELESVGENHRAACLLHTHHSSDETRERPE